MLPSYECQKRYADIECVRHGRELCVVCEVGVGEVVGLGNAADFPGGGSGEVDQGKSRSLTPLAKRASGVRDDNFSVRRGKGANTQTKAARDGPRPLHLPASD